jgi:GH15 family glucan-1,4-alpha-glucosidase
MVAEPLSPESRDDEAEAAPSRRIEDYGLIGNMRSAALVGRDGSIDWLCLPRFDSPACFAALIGNADNGRWQVAPAGGLRATSRRYLPDTAVLETRFETATGAVTLTDFMPLSSQTDKVEVVRIVTGVAGSVDMEMELVLRFEYGHAVPWVRRRDYGLSAVAGPNSVQLHTDLPLDNRDMKTRAAFTVKEGERVRMTLSYHHTTATPQFVQDRMESLQQTVDWWREWIKSSRIDDLGEDWREAMVRSAITLKLLTYAPTGAIVAAPTMALPERIGGERNWDYRCCWLRDSSLTLQALLRTGFRGEAQAWRQWLLGAVAGAPEQLQILYGILGNRWLPEHEVPWLAGFEASHPVRVGNAASNQTQLDVYGEIVNVLHVARAADLQPEDEAWSLQKVLLAKLEDCWQVPDRGIWEVRGEPRAFTHSRMMCWVAFDRAVDNAERYGLDGPVERWRELREAVHADVCAHGFNAELNSFVQAYGSKALDASLLLMPQVGFLPASDPRVLGTIAAIERNLMRDGFVLRYSTTATDDGFIGEEGAFLVCSFWLADAYVMCGRLDDARALLERLMALRNDLGLLAEEYDPSAHRQLGNFPQAFSHIGLINTLRNVATARTETTKRPDDAQTKPRAETTSRSQPASR